MVPAARIVCQFRRRRLFHNQPHTGGRHGNLSRVSRDSGARITAAGRTPSPRPHADPGLSASGAFRAICLIICGGSSGSSESATRARAAHPAFARLRPARICAAPYRELAVASITLTGSRFHKFTLLAFRFGLLRPGRSGPGGLARRSHLPAAPARPPGTGRWRRTRPGHHRDRAQ